MTPTQPTPEEQVEAPVFVDGIGPPLSQIREDHFPPGTQESRDIVHLIDAYLALLTRQSQERAEQDDGDWIELIAVQVDRAEKAEAELDRAVEHLREIFSKPYRAEEVTQRYFAASPGKGAEGGGPLGNIRAEDGKWVTVSKGAWERLCEAVGADPRKGVRDPEAAPIEDEGPADG